MTKLGNVCAGLFTGEFLRAHSTDIISGLLKEAADFRVKRVVMLDSAGTGYGYETLALKVPHFRGSLDEAYSSNDIVVLTHPQLYPASKAALSMTSRCSEGGMIESIARVIGCIMKDANPDFLSAAILVSACSLVMTSQPF